MRLRPSPVFGRMAVVSMIWLYRLLFLPVLIVVSPYYLWRMFKRGGYGASFSQRFGAGLEGLPAKDPARRRIWLQAVSVGEMLAVGPLLEAWKNDPAVEVYLSTTTSTGYKLAGEKYKGLVLAIGYFPLDWWWFSCWAWERIQPDLVVLTEGERWPEHVYQAAQRGIPVFCINARMSDQSYRRLRLMPWARRLMLAETRILACSEHDAGRFRSLGCPADRVVTTGNIKLDLTIPLLDEAAQQQLRTELGFGREPLLVGASTWQGEEQVLVQAYRAVRAAGIDCRLLLVPRHAERRAEVEGELKKAGLSFHLRSRGAAPAPVDICVADTTGELRKLLQLASVVFVGKSLPPHQQGQTPVEAAALGKAVLFGPGMSNFYAISGQLVAGGAAGVVHDAADLAKSVQEILQHPEKAAAMAEAARAWHRNNQGAVKRTLEIIRSA